MRVLLFGATGMVGQGVLRACLADSDVEVVQTVGRSATGVRHGKLREVTPADLFDLSDVAGELDGFHACFFCLGTSSVGASEEEYRRINHDLPLAVADELVARNPAMTFVYVSGQGTGNRKQMWSRVKGETERELLGLGFGGAYMFRPGVMIPAPGTRGKTRLYRVGYAVATPLLAVARRIWPQHVLTTEEVGIAMLQAARAGADTAILEPPDLRALVDRGTASR